MDLVPLACEDGPDTPFDTVCHLHSDGYLLKEIFEKVDFFLNPQMTKKHEKFPRRQRVNFRNRKTMSNP